LRLRGHCATIRLVLARTIRGFPIGKGNPKGGLKMTSNTKKQLQKGLIKVVVLGSLLVNGLALAGPGDGSGSGGGYWQPLEIFNPFSNY